MRSQIDIDAIVRRIVKEPYLWLQEELPFLRERPDMTFALIDRFKELRVEAYAAKVWLCFLVEPEDPSISELLTLSDSEKLLMEAAVASGRLLVRTQPSGKVTALEVLDQELNPQLLAGISDATNALTVWLYDDLRVFANGKEWPYKDNLEVMREIKSRKDRNLLPISQYRKILDAHFQACLRGQRVLTYWSKVNKVLIPSPEDAFQKSLWYFMDNNVQCFLCDMEAVFPGVGRTDIRVVLDDNSLYFFEIKVTGDIGSYKRDLLWVNAGAHQTVEYIRDDARLDSRFHLARGVFVVYDGTNPSLDIDLSGFSQSVLKFDSVVVPLVHEMASAKGSRLAKEGAGLPKATRKRKATQR